MANPVDEYLTARYGYPEEIIKAAAKQAKMPQNQIEDILEWQKQDAEVAAGTREEIDPDLNERAHGYLEATRRSAVKKHKAPLAGDALETKSHTITPKILRKWSPEGGASPTTLAYHEYQRLNRENVQQHSIRGSEDDSRMIGTMQEAYGELEDELGEEPTDEQLLERMNEHLPANKRIDMNRFSELQSRRGGSALTSGFESSPLSYELSAEQQNLALLPYDLNEQERAVFDQAMAGKTTGQIAKETGTSDPTISRVKGSILQKAGVPGGQQQRKRKKPKAPGGSSGFQAPQPPSFGPPAAPAAPAGPPSMGPSVVGRLGQAPNPFLKSRGRGGSNK